MRTIILAAAIIAALFTGVHLATANASTGTRHIPHSTLICARAAMLADDFAHTHTGARAERRAIARCAAQVGGF